MSVSISYQIDSLMELFPCLCCTSCLSQVNGTNAHAQVDVQLPNGNLSNAIHQLQKKTRQNCA